MRRAKRRTQLGQRYARGESPLSIGQLSAVQAEVRRQRSSAKVIALLPSVT